MRKTTLLPAKHQRHDEDFVWISGYLPETDLPKFKAAATKHQWAWAMDDVTEDDTEVPTKVKYGKVSGLIQPVFDILGILPGYRESDISLWFFLFFTLFFAMIIGDAGYGCLILIATIALVAKTKKFNTTTYLLLVLSIATIVWGAVTGTWFGMEKAMHVPFLKALVIPQFANYPEYFGVVAVTQQNAIMKFFFHHRSDPDGIGKSDLYQKETEREKLKLGGRPWLAGSSQSACICYPCTWLLWPEA